MLWIYLYADGLFTPRLPEAIAHALASFGDAWFAYLKRMGISLANSP